MDYYRIVFTADREFVSATKLTSTRELDVRFIEHGKFNLVVAEREEDLSDKVKATITMLRAVNRSPFPFTSFLGYRFSPEQNDNEEVFRFGLESEEDQDEHAGT